MIKGLREKIKFIGNHEIEVIVYVDKHIQIPSHIRLELESMEFFGKINKLIIKDHTDERYGKKYGKNNNDLIYIESLSHATGDYIVHFDADTLAYEKEDYDAIGEHIKLLDKYDYVSIPTPDSPYCVSPDSSIMKGLKYQWASTRYFICKRETIPNTEELLKCLDNKYLKNKYGMIAKPNCLEHILGVIAGPDKVYYPPVDEENYYITSWGSYFNGIIHELSKMDYKDVIKYINDCNNGEYYLDITAKEIR
ncbi:MAG: hypothetical protein ACYSTS_19500 [Planctomycetota bacterium]